jgi:hypothetical protein
MDLNTALRFGQLVSAAYAVPANDLTNRAGNSVSAGSPALAYEVVTSIYANDLATDMNPDRGRNLVSIGLVLQATATADAVIAIRGTEGHRGVGSGFKVSHGSVLVSFEWRQHRGRLHRYV